MGGNDRELAALANNLQIVSTGTIANLGQVNDASQRSQRAVNLLQAVLTGAPIDRDVVLKAATTDMHRDSAKLFNDDKKINQA